MENCMSQLPVYTSCLALFPAITSYIAHITTDISDQRGFPPLYYVRIRASTEIKHGIPPIGALGSLYDTPPPNLVTTPYL